MRLDERIYEYLEHAGERSSLEIRDAMEKAGVWFAWERTGFHLDRMVQADLIERRVTPGGIERGFRDRSYYKIKTAPLRSVRRNETRDEDADRGLIGSTKVPRWG